MAIKMIMHIIKLASVPTPLHMTAVVVIHYTYTHSHTQPAAGEYYIMLWEN